MMPRLHVLVMLGLVAASALTAASMYAQLPDPTPTHWNLRGEVDRYGPRWELAFGVPVVGLLLIGMLVVLPLLGPFRSNLQQFRLIYARISVAIVACIVVIHVVLLLKAAGHSIRIGSTLCVALGALLAVLGNWMGKIRRNFWIGIRTPWTLASEAVWERVHRVGGKLMVVLGIGLVAFGLAGPSDRVAMIGMMSGLGLLAAWAVVYSIVCYRRFGEADERMVPPEG